MEISTQTDVSSFSKSKSSNLKVVDPVVKCTHQSHIRTYQPEDDSIYYRIDGQTCIKIHVFQGKVYFDVRRYKLTEAQKIDVNLFIPDAKPLVNLNPFQK